MQAEFTKDELTALKSMAKYWEEVSQRENKTQLNAEVLQLIWHIGAERVLAMAKHYFDNYKTDEI